MEPLSRPRTQKSHHVESLATGVPELSIVVPTFNESGNVVPFVKNIGRILEDQDWEIIFVDDDSPDGTYDVAKNLARTDTRIRCIRRIGRRGLSTAVIEGILSSSSKYVAVMDGDLQHDESLLPDMLRELESDRADVVIASRYIGDGHAQGLDGRRRHAKSKLGNWLARQLLKVTITDPMSGFFMMPRVVFENNVRSLSGEGFKVLLDFLTSTNQSLRVIELPIAFRERHSGESKLETSVEIAFAKMLLDKTIGRFIPTRFLMFMLVGGSGVFIHLAVLKLAISSGGPFALSQGLAAVSAMTSNFLLNNAITYADRRLRGWSLVRGMLSFFAICSVGLLGNVGVANALFSQQTSWWLSGLVGAVVGAVWNYSASAVYTWRAN